jgi:nondiscriminating glutamyl-tRNA synthetase
MFSTERLIKKSAVFDFGKLDFLNGHYLRQKSGGELAKLAAPFLTGLGAPSQAWLEEALELFKGNAQHLSELAAPLQALLAPAAAHPEAIAALKAFADPQAALKAAQAAFTEMPADAAGVQAKIKEAQKASGVKGKDFFMPLRLALTATEHGPELPRVMLLLGAARVQERLALALEALA